MSNVILYAVVARGSVILAEFSTVQGNASMVALQLLENIRSSDGDRCSYSLDNHVFHILKSNDDLIYLCMSEKSVGRRIPFAFLDDIKSRFTQLHQQTATTANAYELTNSFSPIMRERALFHSDPRNDTVSRVRGEVESLREVMVDNIERVLERGERIELLVQKTDDFAENTFVFKRSAVQLKRQMWWKNTRAVIGIVIAIIVLLYLLAAIVCSPTLQCS